MFEPIPYAVNGELVPADMLRRQLFKQSKGQSGVTLPGDLKVTAQASPNNTVRIAVGSGTAENKFPLGAFQAYDITNPSVTDVTCSAPGGTALTRELIVRVLDPQFAGSRPADGIFVVPQLVGSLPTDYPFIWLATIAQPANTTIVTQAMITDRRRLTAPRSDLVREVNVSTNADLPNSTMTQWPNYTPSIQIPDWATHIKAFARVHGAAQMVSTVFGTLQIELGASPGVILKSAEVGYDFNDTPSQGNGLRLPTLSILLGAALPASFPGTTQRVRIVGKRSGETGYLRSDSYTQTEYDIYFTEQLA